MYGLQTLPVLWDSRASVALDSYSRFYSTFFSNILLSFVQQFTGAGAGITLLKQYCDR